MPDPGRQRVVGLIGCPGAGKTTYARRFDPLDGWVHLTFDDARQALWPPNRQVYWTVRRGGWDSQAHRLLHATKEYAMKAHRLVGHRRSLGFEVGARNPALPGNRR